VKVLDFTLDEVREARLVPVIDFKGRRFAPEGATAHEARRRTRRTEVVFNEP
jgi:ribosome maturation factor RimP